MGPGRLMQPHASAVLCSITIAMIPEYDPNLAKIHRSYTVSEIADLLGCGTHAVLQWIRTGELKPLGGRPYIVHGIALRACLIEKLSRRRHPLQPGEFYCPRCRMGRKSKPECHDVICLEKKLTDDKWLGQARGRCEVCDAQLHQYCAVAKDGGGWDCTTAVSLHNRSIQPMNIPVFNERNEWLKRDYRIALRAGGYAENTIAHRMRSLDTWEVFIERRDFWKFNVDDAEVFNRFFVGESKYQDAKAIISFNAQQYANGNQGLLPSVVRPAGI